MTYKRDPLAPSRAMMKEKNLVLTPQQLARFWSRVSKMQQGDCWLWQGSLCTKGYARFTAQMTQFQAHRISYMIHHGPIPDGLVCDHLCRVRHCVNPAHLEPVTSAENTRRGDIANVRRAEKAAMTHCKRGHPFSAENVFFHKKTGKRACRECKRMHHRNWYSRKVAR